MHIITGEISPLGSIPEEPIRSKRVSSKIVSWNDDLYIAPLLTKKIWKYNQNNQQWTGYKREELCNWTRRQDMSQAVLYKDRIFFIGCLYPAIIVMNPYTDDIKYITSPYNEKMELVSKKKEIWFRTDYVIKNNYIYLASCVDDTVLCMDLDTYEYEYKQIGEKSYAYSGIGWDGELFYLSPRNTGPIVIWDGEKIVGEIDIKFPPNEKKILGSALCLEDKIVFPAIFSKNTVELIKNVGYQIVYRNKQYFFYEKIDQETIVSLDTEGIIEIIWNNKTYIHETNLMDSLFWNQFKERPFETGITMKGINYEKTTEDLRALMVIL